MTPQEVLYLFKMIFDEGIVNALKELIRTLDQTIM